jgi:dUTP pyrophosphatase
MTVACADIPLLLLPHAAGPPVYATEGAAGADLLAAIDRAEIMEPGARFLAPTGVALALPHGVEAQIRPRSGLAIKNGVTVLNAPGTIDWDYRGEIMVPLVNLGETPFALTRGMRIAQMVFASVTRAQWRQMQQLPETVRGTGGFGSTGLEENPVDTINTSPADMQRRQ